MTLVCLRRAGLLTVRLAAQVLRSEQDLSTKRNAFQMLCNHAQDLATNYLLSQVRQVAAACGSHTGVVAYPLPPLPAQSCLQQHILLCGVSSIMLPP